MLDFFYSKPTFKLFSMAKISDYENILDSLSVNDLKGKDELSEKWFESVNPTDGWFGDRDIVSLSDKLVCRYIISNETKRRFLTFFFGFKRLVGNNDREKKFHFVTLVLQEEINSEEKCFYKKGYTDLDVDRICKIIFEEDGERIKEREKMELGKIKDPLNYI